MLLFLVYRDVILIPGGEIAKVTFENFGCVNWVTCGKKRWWFYDFLQGGDMKLALNFKPA